MAAYPYDYALFHPGYFCSTCRRAKPARSKHCSLCRTCVQRQDHHCIWINNCVGRNNYVWFVLLLVAISVLLGYGASLGLSLLDANLQARFVPPSLIRGSLTAKRWSTKLSWTEYLDCWLWAIGVEWQIGAVSLLALLSFPMSVGFLVYHLYLIWAGMTTNETSKWSDWREDIADGLVYRAEIAALRSDYKPLPQDIEPSEDTVTWPERSFARWWLIRTRNGLRPTIRSASESDGIGQDADMRDELDEVDERWEKVNNLKDVDNLYDQGFWANFKDGLLYRD